MTEPLKNGGLHILHTEQAVNDAVQRIASEVSLDYLFSDRLTLLCVLSGGAPFCFDLLRYLDAGLAERTQFRFVRAASYYNTDQGPLTITGLPEDLEGADVLIVEDIVDTGVTMSDLLIAVKAFKPKSVRVASFIIRSGGARIQEVWIDYIGLEVPEDCWVVGYGLDCNEQFRSLRWVGALPAWDAE